MELVFLGAILLAAMATVDIPEAREEEEGAIADLRDRGQKPYGVRG
ncbi:MAG: hypothetical protein RLZ25_272 [Pseudomonadota bacterium]|jgi:hypothetical protein